MKILSFPLCVENTNEPTDLSVFFQMSDTAFSCMLNTTTFEDIYDIYDFCLSNSIGKFNLSLLEEENGLTQNGFIFEHTTGNFINLIK